MRETGDIVRDSSGQFVFLAFLLGLALSTGFAFSGYAALGTATALHAAHHDQEKDASNTYVQLQRMGALDDAQQRIEMMRAIQALKGRSGWCEPSGPAFLRPFFVWSTGPEFASLCGETRSQLDAAERHLVDMSLSPDLASVGYGAVANRLLDFLDASSRFPPILSVVEDRVAFAVRRATLAMSGVLLFVGALAVRLRGRTMKTLRDIEAANQRNRERFQRALQRVRDGLGSVDRDGRIVDANPSLKELLSTETPSWQLDSALRSAFDTGRILEARRDGIKVSRVEAVTTALHRPIELDLELEGGRFVRLSCEPIPDGGAVMVAADFTELRESNQKLAALTERLREARMAAEMRSRSDALTGLSNRRAFDEALVASDVRSTVVVRADLDRFKAVNDTFGHATGDAVLIHVAKILREEADPEALVARVGGDEFVALYPDCNNLEDAADYAARAGERVRTPFLLNGRTVPFGISFGIASGATLDDTASGMDVLAAADVALYRAKAAGRNTEALYSPAMHRRVVEHRHLADRFATALETKVFEPFYQPQVKAGSEDFSGLEVLARWPEQDGTTVAPGVFLPVAEELRCLPDLDAVIFEKVERDLQRWQAADVRIPKIALNVSSSRLGDDSFAAGVARLTGLGVQVSVELLESVLLEELDGRLDWQLDQLREAGARIEVDDFGSGHASVMGLYRVKPDCLKLDRRIVEAAADEAFGGAPESVLRAVIEIGKALGTEVVAEGVETREVADHLARLGVDTLQGFHFAQPLPFDAVAPWIAARAAPDANGMRALP